MPDDPDAEILLELNRIGGAVEVRAVSASDGLEIAFTAPANAAHADLERVARLKLGYVRSKGKRGQGPSGNDRGGIVV